MRGRRPWFINRLPYSVHLQMQRQVGFELCAEMIQKVPSEITRGQLASQFQFLTDQDMSTAGALFVVMKASN
jgi:hypothetical protein